LGLSLVGSAYAGCSDAQLATIAKKALNEDPGKSQVFSQLNRHPAWQFQHKNPAVNGYNYEAQMGDSKGYVINVDIKADDTCTNVSKADVDISSLTGS